MEYRHARVDLKSGDVVATASNTFFSRVIRLFTKSEFSHVGIILDIHGRKLILEAVPPVVRVIPASLKAPFYVIKMDEVLSPEAENYAFTFIGSARYSILEAIKSYFYKNRDPDAWQCTELVKEVLGANRRKIDCKDTPSALVEYLLKDGKSLIYVE